MNHHWEHLSLKLPKPSCPSPIPREPESTGKPRSGVPQSYSCPTVGRGLHSGPSSATEVLDDWAKSAPSGPVSQTSCAVRPLEFTAGGSDIGLRVRQTWDEVPILFLLAE